MRWKLGKKILAVALTGALAVMFTFSTVKAFADKPGSGSATLAMFTKAQIDKAEMKILTTTPGALAGGFTFEPYATFAQIKVGDAIATDKKSLQPYAEPARLALAKTEFVLRC